MASYIPDRGDIVWLDFDPSKGHEQSKRRPALTVTVKKYNKKTGLALFTPITSQLKGYPFEVILPERLKASGAILTDQLRTMDWKARNVEFICKLPNTALEEVLAKVRVLLD